MRILFNQLQAGEMAQRAEVLASLSMITESLDPMVEGENRLSQSCISISHLASDLQMCAVAPKHLLTHTYTIHTHIQE